MRKGKVLTKLVFSYSAMIAMSIIVSICVYYFTYGIVKNQANAHNKNLLDVIKSTCDSEIRYYKNFLEQIERIECVRKLGRDQEYNTSTDYWNDYMVKQELEQFASNMAHGNSYCHDIFLYLSKTDKVINKNSGMDYSMYSRLVCENRKDWSEYLKQNLLETVGGKVISLHSGEEDYLVLLDEVNGIGINKGFVISGIWIDMDVINHKINAIDWDGGMDWMIIDGQGTVLRKPDYFSVEELESIPLFEKSSLRMSISGEQYLVNTLESDYYNLQYVLFTPETMVGSPARKIRTLNFASLIIILVTGFFAAAYFTKMHYHPIKSLLLLFRDNVDKAAISNEYEYLEQKVSGVLQKSADAENKNRSLVRGYALEKLLQKQIYGMNTEEQEERVYNKFRKGKNIVLICYETDETQKKDGEAEYIKEKGLKRYIIRNVFEEGISLYFQQETFEYENRIVTIINIPVEENDSVNILHSQIEQLREFIDVNYHFNFLTLEGGSHEGLEGISQSWLEACQTEEFVNDLCELYIRFEEIRDMTVYSYSYSFDMEECIVDAVRKGDTRLAQSIIDNVLQNCFGQGISAISEMQTCILYDIFGTLVKASEEQGINISRMPKLNMITAETKPEVLRDYFYEIIEDICTQIEKELKTVHGKRIADDIYEYIVECYMDPDLNISQIAYHFHMTPAWISATYKKQTGKGLVNVIKQVRIDNAKRLLREGLSVVEVSRMVGFRESTTFIRTFKGCTGITPGQLKRTNSNEWN